MPLHRYTDYACPYINVSIPSCYPRSRGSFLDNISKSSLTALFPSLLTILLVRSSVPLSVRQAGKRTRVGVASPKSRQPREVGAEGTSGLPYSLPLLAAYEKAFKAKRFPAIATTIAQPFGEELSCAEMLTITRAHLTA
uniref:Orf138b n=1 Tax=Batis maritima TaxID=4436 RepID=A0A068BBY1_BATMA|nr:orf138b [Batis maritima]AIC83420.1 orf138b [Batis maritima]